MNIQVIASTNFEMFESHLEILYPEEVANGQILFFEDEPDPAENPVLLVPESHRWERFRKNDADLSKLISRFSTKKLKERHEISDPESARVYLGCSLVMRCPEIDEILRPQSAEEMLVCFRELPIKKCRFVLTVAMENPYCTEAMPVLGLGGTTKIKEKADESDMEFFEKYPDDTVGAFIRFVDMEVALEASADEFAQHVVHYMQRLIRTPISSSFN